MTELIQMVNTISLPGAIVLSVAMISIVVLWRS